MGKILHPVRSICHHLWVGRAIVATSSNITVLESRFERNSAIIGGAIFSELFTNTSFSKNCADSELYYKDDICIRDGCVLYGDSGVSITIQDSHFTNNNAYEERYDSIGCGGVVFVKGASDVTLSCPLNINNDSETVMVNKRNNIILLIINHSQFINNSAHSEGGRAVYAQSYVNITIIYSEFRAMKSVDNTLLYASDNVNINVTKSQFFATILLQKLRMDQFILLQFLALEKCEVSHCSLSVHQQQCTFSIQWSCTCVK